VLPHHPRDVTEEHRDHVGPAIPHSLALLLGHKEIIAAKGPHCRGRQVERVSLQVNRHHLHVLDLNTAATAKGTEDRSESTGESQLANISGGVV